MSLFKMKNEPVADRIPFLGVGSGVLELVKLGRGRKRDESKYSYLTFKVLESDTPEHPVNSYVTKWILDKSFSAQKDIKIVMGALINKPVSEIIFEEIVPFFYDESKKDPEPDDHPIEGSGTEILAGRKIRFHGKFGKKKDRTISTFPQHDFIALDEPLDA